MKHEMYSYILAGIAIIVVLWFAMKLRLRIRRDKAKQAFRERVRPGPPLRGHRSKH
jgi:hypothetical protein